MSKLIEILCKALILAVLLFLTKKMVDCIAEVESIKYGAGRSSDNTEDKH